MSALNLSRVNNKDTRLTSMTSFWCLFRVSMVDFDRVTACWMENSKVVISCQIFCKDMRS